MKVLEFKTISSTNTFAKDYLKNYHEREEILIFSDFQTQGRGNANNLWHSEAEKNMLFSLIVFPDIEIKNFFSISMSVSLSILEFLQQKNISAKIKWPNDIYIENKKISGILIENTIKNNIITNSIIGIGFNINQSEFPEYLPNPISLKNIINKDTNLTEEMLSLANIITNNIKKIPDYEQIKAKYLENLYKFQVFSNFMADNNCFRAKIIDIDNFGQMVLELENAKIKTYSFKEIKFLIV